MDNQYRTVPVLRRETCRLCGSKHLELVLPLESSPIADAYVSRECLNEPQESYPLDLYMCLECGHVQNLDVVNPALLFREYLYETSVSRGLVNRYRTYADEVSERFQLRPDQLVVEIGSNDGSFLRFFKSKGLRCLGVDPAMRIATAASVAGIPTIPDFFTSSLAHEITEEYGMAALVAANNVFAHADDLADIAIGIRNLLQDDGVFVFEVSYLVDIVDRFLFDTVYHEHVSYHSIAPLVRFFDNIGLQVFDVWSNTSKGGSIRVFVQRRNTACRPVSPKVSEFLQLERQKRIADPGTFHRYSESIAARKRQLLTLMDEERRLGKRFVGYGASTTVTTLMYQFDLPGRLEYLVDDNPRKQNLYSPGAHLPVLPSDELYSRGPDYVVILAWNYASPIISRHGEFLRRGGKFLMPLPEFRVIDAASGPGLGMAAEASRR